MSAQSDFTFRFDGLFIRLMPHNDEAETNWRILTAHYPNCTIPAAHWNSVSAQLRKAGYSIRKAPAPRPATARSRAADDALLEALEAE